MGKPFAKGFLMRKSSPKPAQKLHIIGRFLRWLSMLQVKMGDGIALISLTLSREKKRAEIARAKHGYLLQVIGVSASIICKFTTGMSAHGMTTWEIHHADIIATCHCPMVAREEFTCFERMVSKMTLAEKIKALDPETIVQLYDKYGCFLVARAKFVSNLVTLKAWYSTDVEVREVRRAEQG